MYFYLYLIMDIYSRKIVTWQVHERECAEYAAALAHEACYVEGVDAREVVLHADWLADERGDDARHARAPGRHPFIFAPAVSDDNPFSESLFRTLKFGVSRL